MFNAFHGSLLMLVLSKQALYKSGILVSYLVLLGGQVAHASSDFVLEKAELRAQLSPIRHAILSAEMTGKIAKLNVREGQRVNKNDPLVEFDCALQKAQLDKAQTQYDATKNTLTGHKRMEELNAIGSVELVNSQLEVRKAKADVKYLKVTLDRCVIRAPYAGTIGDQFSRAHEFIQLGKPLLEIQDDSELLLEFIVPSRWLSWLVPEFEFDIMLDDTGKTYPVKISHIAAKVDALSQSVKAVAVINGEFSELLPGMSGSIKFTQPEQN